MRVRPLHDWVLVKMEPLPEATPGGIVLAGTSVAERQRTGTVLRLGPGRRCWSDRLKKEIVKPMDVEVGERVVFFRENLEHQQGKAIMGVLQQLEEDVGLIRTDDILYSLGHS
jgi:co-chaperonin GroES (HSP10)